MDSTWIGVAEAASLLGVHKNTIRHRMKTGVYTSRKVMTPNGEAYEIPRSEVEGVQTPTKDLVPSDEPTIAVTRMMQDALKPFLAEHDALVKSITERDQRIRELEKENTQLRSGSWVQRVLISLVRGVPN